MPWHVERTQKCPVSRPFGVLKDSDSSVVGCHTTQEAARAQLRALYVNEPKARAAMADLTGVEIARVGEWQLASGPLDVTEDMLIDAAAYAARDGARPAPLKLGHEDPRFDGEPALGWLHNLRVEGAGADAVLLGDVTGMPDWLAVAAPTAWPDRSMEGWTDYEEGDRTYAMVVDGLALLGVTPPGMSTLRSLRDLPQALGVAASARIVAHLTPKLPTASADGSTHTEGGSAVAFSDEQITNLRAKLQLPETADEAAILAAVNAVVDESLEDRPATADTPPTGGQPAPTAASEPAPPAAAPVAAAPVSGTPGTMVIDTAAWEAREEDIRRLKAKESKREREERDQVIATAISAGKFPPARVDHWKRLWDADPEGTRQVIDGLAANVVPVTAMGEPGTSEDGLDEEFAHLFPPTHSSKGA